MSISKRREREIEEMHNTILTAADNIIKSEGIDKLSIRKIAKEIDYSPAIIYHYFRDKQDILNYIMEKDYKQIINVLSSVYLPEEDPMERLKKSLRKYIELALQMGEQYKNILISSSPSILEYTSVLFKGASNKRQGIGMLYKCLQDILNDIYENDDTKLELTAQIIWTATFGLMIRLIIEKDISKEQQELLIDHHIKIITDSIYPLSKQQ